MRFAVVALTIGLFLVSSSAQAQSRGKWSDVERFPAGRVVVTDETGAVIRGRLLRADADAILLYAPKVDTRQLKAIEGLARDRTGLLSRVDTIDLDVPDAGLWISVTGISRKKVPVAAFADVFHVAPRRSVVSVVEPKDQRHSVLGTVAGVAVGGAAGWFSGMFIAFGGEGHSHSQGRELAVGAAIVGGPVLGGMAGNALSKPKDDRVLYRR